MNLATRLAPWGLAACLIGTSGLLSAQDEGFTKSFKFRLGYSPSESDHLRRSALGFGLDLGYGVAGGRAGVELGYFYKTGDEYITSPSNMTPPTGLQPVDTTKAKESKRNQLDGFTVRLGYSRAFDTDLRWQAGVQLGTRFKHQYEGDAVSQQWGPDWGSARPANTWRDLYNGTPTSGGLNPSPFGGITWKLDASSSLEFNLALISYKAIEYNHAVGTASSYDPGGRGAGNSSAPWIGRVSSLGATWSQDQLTSKNRMIPHLEIAYVFHF
ncbi:hypothetical protein [Geothrix sp. PMB-07]|uniref:hypothetical protein n=1 Tax=Geothrix sp. PMB-07 TaxID=3068640 RepID=UPI002740CF8C|nr:hypothetical protein [Geothrix sp. PMB-07]WLT32362.1 hypothetical protein Q9293_03310 [Geothrix sp. PMB-07]